MKFQIGEVVVPFCAFGGIFTEMPEGKLINYDNGVYHVDLNYMNKEPRVIRCCLVRKVRK